MSGRDPTRRENNSANFCNDVWFFFPFLLFTRDGCLRKILRLHAILDVILNDGMLWPDRETFGFWQLGPRDLIRRLSGPRAVRPSENILEPWASFTCQNNSCTSFFPRYRSISRFVSSSFVVRVRPPNMGTVHAKVSVSPWWLTDLIPYSRILYSSHRVCSQLISLSNWPLDGLQIVTKWSS